MSTDMTRGDFTAKAFVSNVSPYLLHKKFLPPDARNKLWMRRLDALQPGASAVAVFIGLTQPAATILPSCIAFWFDSPDHDAIYLRATGEAPSAKIEHLVLLHTPEGDDNRTLMLMTFAKQSQSSQWRRDKEPLARLMLETACRQIPGLRESVAFTETASPDTFERYTGNTGGGIYGFENRYGRYSEAKMPMESHIGNLFQVGHWGRSGGGVWNVMADGRYAARMIQDVVASNKLNPIKE